MCAVWLLFSHACTLCISLMIERTSAMLWLLSVNISGCPVVLPLIFHAADAENDVPQTLEAAARAGQPVEMENFFSRLTLDIIGKAVFDYDFDSLTHDDPVIKVRAAWVTLCTLSACIVLNVLTVWQWQRVSTLPCCAGETTAMQPPAQIENATFDAESAWPLTFLDNACSCSLRLGPVG